MQKGFSYIAVLIAVVVVSVISFSAWRVVTNDNKAQQAATNTQTASAPTQSQTPTQAVDATVKEVDAIVVDDPALDQIEAELDY